MSKRIVKFMSLGLLAAFLILTGLNSCMKEEKKAAKSIEQIQNEEGVPVKVSIIETKTFEKYLTFFAKLSGIKEATKNSLVGDKIEKINAKVGDYVKEGQVIYVFPANNPALQYSQAKHGYELAEKTFNRMKELAKAGETAQANLDGAETQYNVAKRNYESLKQLLFIESPISGQIVELLAKEGEEIGMNKPLFTVAQLDIMKAKIWVSEKEVSMLRNGLEALVNVGGKEYRGRITEISLMMDDRMRAFGVEIQFPNSKRELRSGVTVDVKIKVSEKPNVIVIPRILVKQDEGKKYVFVDSEGKASKRFIEIGDESGLDIIITGGLNPGDRLITEGVSLLGEGKKIKLLN